MTAVNNSSKREQPDVAIANEIVTRLVDDGLLPPPFAQRLTTQLAGGSINAGEWRRLAEQIVTWEMQEGDDEP